MNIIEDNENIILEEVEDFDIEQILECGQCFRFYKVGIKDYIIVAYEKMLHIKQEKNSIIMFNTSKSDFDKIWKKYFDLDTDYAKIKKELLKKDNKLKESIETMYGIRILKQEFFETLLSFIISQNKKIPHIMKIVECLSEKYGKVVGEYNDKVYYSFPSIERMINVTEEEFRECKTGFRAPYLVSAIQKVYAKDVDYDKMLNMSTEKTEEMLKSIKGVGEKVANCVMLFSLGKMDSFPVDVWIKRIMEKLYYNGKDVDKKIIKKFAQNHYGEYGGYAQQYLFYYGRMKQ